MNSAGDRVAIGAIYNAFASDAGHVRIANTPLDLGVGSTTLTARRK